MTLSWNEIKARAALFVAQWLPVAEQAREEADAQTFETGFLDVFGITRSQIAIFVICDFLNFHWYPLSNGGFQPLLFNTKTGSNEDLKDYSVVPEKVAFTLAEHIDIPDFNSRMRETLLECCRLDWSKISPTIFGAMFQSVMNDDERHDLGTHYTSEENILKVIKPLFLDDLWEEFEAMRGKHGARHCERSEAISKSEDCFVPRNDAKSVRDRFGQYFARIPLTASPTIVCGNALDLDWDAIINSNNTPSIQSPSGIHINRTPQCPNNETPYGVSQPYPAFISIDMNALTGKKSNLYIIGNPPFLGSRVMNKQQKAELKKIFRDLKNCGDLDYVTCWYRKAAVYLTSHPRTECAFVSTNSICQGLQAPLLWKLLMRSFAIKINFAHQTFKWTNEARGKAAVYCIIVGFSRIDREKKFLYTYRDIRGEAEKILAKQINHYLLDAEIIFLKRRQTPLCDVPEMSFGNMPLDGGNLLFSEDEKDGFLMKEPDGSTLADLYDPLTMPPALLKAHQALYSEVDRAYIFPPSGGQREAYTDAARVAFLFRLYKQLTEL